MIMYGLVLQEFKKNDHVYGPVLQDLKKYQGAHLATIALALAWSSIDGRGVGKLLKDCFRMKIKLCDHDGKFNFHIPSIYQV